MEGCDSSEAVPRRSDGWISLFEILRFQGSSLVEGLMFSKFFSAFSLWPGEVCVKDTNHCVLHFRHHRGVCANVKDDKHLTATERAIWAQRGSVLGWSDPTFAHGSVAKVTRGVAPAQSSRCAALNSIAAFA